jgi:hypothetical protein
VLVTAAASTLGDSYCSLAWGKKLAEAAGSDVAAAVIRGEDDAQPSRASSDSARNRPTARDSPSTLTTPRSSPEATTANPVSAHGLSTSLDGVLDLTDEQTLTSAELTAADLVRSEHAFTQQVGEAAHKNGLQAIRSASATGTDAILALFPENLGGATIDVELVEVWESIGDVSA